MAKNNKHAEEEKELKLNYGRQEDYRLFYADRTEFRVSPFDFKLNFVTTQSLLNGELLFLEQATAVLSPQHAKQLSRILAKNVASYERDFGEINMEWEANEPNEPENMTSNSEEIVLKEDL